ncbi:MAG: hypothetical protein AB1649_24305 [Chloroflexota bacterium]
MNHAQQAALVALPALLVIRGTSACRTIAYLPLESRQKIPIM